MGVISWLYRGCIGVMLVLHWGFIGNNGKQNGNYYNGLYRALS